MKRNDQEKLRIHSLNKREALVLASFEDSVREQIFLKLLGIMEALSDKPKKTKIVKIGK
ncbi:MAG: hypothetical protein U9O98_00505 [Asgard group archaeon]|nr:hypothetical protein [Asgard group archaeon]